jgi:hypothetical protein
MQVNHALTEEIHEINQQLIDTELHISEDDAESFAATSEGAEGTVIRCTFTAVAVSPSLKSMFASAQMVRQPHVFSFFLLVEGSMLPLVVSFCRILKLCGRARFCR